MTEAPYDIRKLDHTLNPGSEIEVTGHYTGDGEFSWGWICGLRDTGVQSPREYMFYLNCRHNEGVAILNHTEKYVWPTGKRTTLSVPTNTDVAVKIKVLDPHRYQVQVLHKANGAIFNGEYSTDYHSAMDAKYIGLWGLTNVSVSPSYAGIQPFTEGFPAKLKLGQVFKLSGSAPSDCGDFEIKFEAESGDIPIYLGFHFSVGQIAGRYKGFVERNSIIDSQWDLGDRNGGNPLIQGEKFELIVEMKKDIFNIQIGGKNFSSIFHENKFPDAVKISVAPIGEVAAEKKVTIDQIEISSENVEVAK